MNPEGDIRQVCRRDRSGFVLVTVEFQSHVDRTMAVRVLEYSTLRDFKLA